MEAMVCGGLRFNGVMVDKGEQWRGWAVIVVGSGGRWASVVVGVVLRAADLGKERGMEIERGEWRGGEVWL